jgi:hypothetical protein
MTQTIEAIFDGKVIRPDQPLALAVNTRVRVTIEPIAETPCSRHSFLNTAREIKIKGPPDWSARLDDYLYGDVK